MKRDWTTADFRLVAAEIEKLRKLDRYRAAAISTLVLAAQKSLPEHLQKSNTAIYVATAPGNQAKSKFMAQLVTASKQVAVIDDILSSPSSVVPILELSEKELDVAIMKIANDLVDSRKQGSSIYLPEVMSAATKAGIKIPGRRYPGTVIGTIISKTPGWRRSRVGVYRREIDTRVAPGAITPVEPVLPVEAIRKPKEAVASASSFEDAILLAASFLKRDFESFIKNELDAFSKSLLESIRETLKPKQPTIFEAAKQIAPQPLQAPVVAITPTIALVQKPVEPKPRHNPEPISAPRIPKQRIDIIGFNHDGKITLAACQEAQMFDIRFIDTDHARGLADYAPDAILGTKFISHTVNKRLKKFGVKMHYANGGISGAVSIIQELAKTSA